MPEDISKPAVPVAPDTCRFDARREPAAPIKMARQPLDVQAVKFAKETLSGATLQVTTAREKEKAAHLNRVHSLTVCECSCAFAPANIAKLPAEEARHPFAQQRVISVAPKPLHIAPPSFGHDPVVASNEQSQIVAKGEPHAPAAPLLIELSVSYSAISARANRRGRAARKPSRPPCGRRAQSRMHRPSSITPVQTAPFNLPFMRVSQSRVDAFTRHRAVL
jgi:hypothetical protein